MPPSWRKAPAITEASEMKKVLVALMLGMGLVALGAGCGKDEPKDDKAGAAASGDKIGVAECDDYVTKYEACIKKAGGPAAAAAEPGLKAQRDAFKQSAATPEGKAALKTSCKSMLDGLATNPMCK
jgi:hypothetical protein